MKFTFPLLALLISIALSGCNQNIEVEKRSSMVESAPACNGTAEQATPCLEEKVIAWRTALNLPGHDSTYDVFRAACEVGDPDGCWMLGRALEGDSHMGEAMRNAQSYVAEETNPELGATFIQKSCELGSEYGCLYHAANVAEKANWDPTELEGEIFENLMSVFFEACKQGFLTGCGGYFDLSMRLDSPLSSENEKFAAEQLCDAKIGSGCHIVATYLMSEAANYDEHKLALPYWRKGCEAGDETACRAYAGNMDYLGNADEFNWSVSTACTYGFDPSKWPQDATVPYPACPIESIAK